MIWMRYTKKYLTSQYEKTTWSTIKLIELDNDQREDRLTQTAAAYSETGRKRRLLFEVVRDDDHWANEHETRAEARHAAH